MFGLKDLGYAVLTLLLVALWIAAGVYISYAHTDTASLSNTYPDDTNLATAAKWSLIAEVITWSLVVLGAILFVLGIVVQVVGFEILPEIEALIPGKAKLLGAVLLVSVLSLISLLAVTGVCGIVASTNVHTSANYDASNKKFSDGYKNSTIAASLAFVSVGLLVLGFVSLEIAKAAKKKKKAAAAAAAPAGTALSEVEAILAAA